MGAVAGSILWYAGTADHPWYIATNWNGSQAPIIFGSYALNLWTWPAYAPRSMAEPPGYLAIRTPAYPSQTPVFADAAAPGLVFFHPYEPPSTDLYTGLALWLTIARHGSRPASAAPRNVDISKPLPGMIDLALYDGHVEKTRLEDLWNYYWSANWQVPHPRPGE